MHSTMRQPLMKQVSGYAPFLLNTPLFFHSMYKNDWNINSYLLTDKEEVWNDTDMGDILKNVPKIRERFKKYPSLGILLFCANRKLLSFLF